MPMDITKELQKTYRKAVMQNEAKSLKQGQDWQQANTIIERGDAQRANLEDKYGQEYESRVEIARNRLIKEAGELGLDHPAPAGRNKFDGEAINRQAHREVQFDHERVLQQSLDAQNTDMQVLQEKARKRDLLKSMGKGKAKNHFTQANDQRSGLDRRAPSRSR